ncbi:hypothetical protein LN386_25320, partial [Enterobacter hormaechei subsp. steigerwaltii]|nr:hypothetical protein [Enterobacter hormaechei subsp. steigerwaltii]
IEGEVGLVARCFEAAGDFGVADVGDAGVQVGFVEFERTVPSGIFAAGGKCAVDGFNFNAVVPECQRGDLGGQVEVAERSVCM